MSEFRYVGRMMFGSKTRNQRYRLILNSEEASEPLGYNPVLPTLSALSYDTVHDTAQLGIQGVLMTPDGDTMIYPAYDANIVVSTPLSTAWDMSTEGSASSHDPTTATAGPAECFFNDDGTKFYLCAYSTGQVQEYALSTAYDVSGINGATASATISVAGLGGTFANEGTYLYVGTLSAINRYTCSTPYEISTAVLDYTDSLPAPVSQRVDGIVVNDDGTRIWVLKTGTTTEALKVYQFTLGTAYDTRTASLDVGEEIVLSSVHPTATNPSGLFVPAGRNELYISFYSATAVERFTWT